VCIDKIYLKLALTEPIDDCALFMKGIDVSYSEFQIEDTL